MSSHSRNVRWACQSQVLWSKGQLRTANLVCIFNTSQRNLLDPTSLHFWKGNSSQIHWCVKLQWGKAVAWFPVICLELLIFVFHVLIKSVLWTFLGNCKLLIVLVYYEIIICITVDSIAVVNNAAISHSNLYYCLPPLHFSQTEMTFTHIFHPGRQCNCQWRLEPRIKFDQDQSFYLHLVLIYKARLFTISFAAYSGHKSST